MATVAIPGQVLGTTATHDAGLGTHATEAQIFASISGQVNTSTRSDRGSKATFSITSREPSSARNRLPVVGSVVTCRITRVQQRQATGSILLLGYDKIDLVPEAFSSNDEYQFQALLRREDVRQSEKDKVVMNEMFRTGDIIRGTVISIGDERTYYINTIGNDFGVVIARSESGNAMIASSWKEMQDVVTGQRELRKVAKPI